MKIQRHLAKLAPRTPGYHVRSTHGTALGAGTPWEDVAAAIAQIRRPADGGGQTEDTLVQSLLLYRWCGHEHLRERVVSYLIAEISKIAVEHEWSARRKLPPGTLRILCEGALEEYHTAQACRPCSATGWEHVDLVDPSRNRTCEVCAGSGRLWWSKRRRARRCGYGQRTWRLVWDERYLRVLERILSKERVGMRRLAALLEEPRRA